MFMLTLISYFLQRLGKTPEAFQSGQVPTEQEALLLEPFEGLFLLLSSSLQKDRITFQPERLCA